MKRRIKQKKNKVLSRQAKGVCKLLTGNGEIDITQKASIPVIDSNNLNREALHTKLRKRFHLEPLKHYNSDKTSHQKVRGQQDCFKEERR